MRRLAATSTALIAALAGPAVAYDLPPVNLGFTSFLDGAPPSGPGWYFQQYLQTLRSGKLMDANGDQIQLPTASGLKPVSYTHLTLPTIVRECRSRWSPYH